jgi:elongation factor Ts
MAITAQEVNKLRQQTGAGMMDCKKALEENNGDFEQAIDYLRKKGAKVAANRGDRDSKEGVVLAKTSADNKRGILIWVNCETDFVAINADFIAFADSIATIALEKNAKTKEEILTLPYNGDITVGDKFMEQVGKIGEKIEIGYFETITAEKVSAYIHPGNRVSVIVGFNQVVADEVGRNVAMQAAAMNPIALNEAGVDADTIAKEIEIAKDMLRQEGKPEAMIENIAKGKLGRFFKDNTLVNQDYIKDSSMSVANYVKSVDANLIVTGFKRAALG